MRLGPRLSWAGLGATLEEADMRTTRFQLWVTWLCLIAFGASNTLLRSGLVVCSDHEGQRIEWGCDRNEAGECLSSGDSRPATHSDDSKPCDDDALPSDTAPAPTASRGNHVPPPDLLPVPLMIADFGFGNPPSSLRAISVAGGDRHPYPAVMLRCVVLIV